MGHVSKISVHNRHYAKQGLETEEGSRPKDDET